MATVELTPQYPSGRAEDSPNTGVGVDTVAVVGPTTSRLLDELRFQQRERAVDFLRGDVTIRSRGSSETVDLGLARARLRGRWLDGRPIVSLETSLPTMLLGHNRNALPAELLPDAVEAALILLADLLPDVPALDTLTLVRLDVTRDFSSVVPSDVLDVMARRSVPHAREDRRHHRPDGRLQSLARGSLSRWLVRGYDKAFEMQDTAVGVRESWRRRLLLTWSGVSEGRLRFEVQARARLLRERGIMAVTDTTSEHVTELGRAYFERARWDLPYGGKRQTLVLRELAASLSRAEYKNVLALRASERDGLDVHAALGRHALERARAIARRHDLLGDDDSGAARRLDFDAGQEVPT